MSSEKSYMKKPCKHCPFRMDVTPFLHPERAADIAYNASNKYGSFPCHKTTEADDSEYADGEMMAVETTKECAGHLTMQFNENGSTFYDNEGFKPSFDLVYSEPWDMIEAYTEKWESRGS